MSDRPATEDQGRQSATPGSGDPSAGGYVPALDGLRAVAVLLVLLFHLRVPGFRAGFLGVDIFFVLSGFLITTLLLTERNRRGRISLPDFWARRARRLLPALLLLLVVVAVFTWATATYTQRASVRGDLLATSGYVANWRFISTSSYFADIGVDSPLEHTWSLAIEEQFYVFWPLLVVAAVASRRPRLAVFLVAIGVGALSLALLRLLWSPEGVERAYMGTDARIFEPLIGAAGAALIAGPRVIHAVDRWRTAILVVGATGLVAGTIAIGAHPSFYFAGGAAVVALGTLAILGPIWIGSGGAVGAALAWRPAAWIGAVSYGAYLWHWPLTVWLGAREGSGADRLLRQAAVVALTFGIAAASYYLLERPIRRRASASSRTIRVRRRRVTLISIPISLLAVAGISLAATNVPPVSPRDPVMMLVGDSVPLHLSVALDDVLEDRGWRLVSSTFGSCPVTGEAPAWPDGTAVRDAHRCSQKIVRSQNRLIRDADPDVVVWWDRWIISGFLTPGGGNVRSGTPRFWRLRRERLEATFDRLTRRGATVAFVAIEPPGTGATTRCTYPRCEEWISFQIDHYDDITARWNRMMRRFAREHTDAAVYVSVTDVICAFDTAPCDDRIGKVPARPDGTHYEGRGEDLVIRTLLSRLGGLVRPVRPTTSS